MFSGRRPAQAYDMTWKDF